MCVKETSWTAWVKDVFGSLNYRRSQAFEQWGCYCRKKHLCLNIIMQACSAACDCKLCNISEAQQYLYQHDSVEVVWLGTAVVCSIMVVKAIHEAPYSFSSNLCSVALDKLQLSLTASRTTMTLHTTAVPAGCSHSILVVMHVSKHSMLMYGQVYGQHPSDMIVKGTDDRHGQSVPLTTSRRRSDSGKCMCACIHVCCRCGFSNWAGWPWWTNPVGLLILLHEMEWNRIFHSVFNDHSGSLWRQPRAVHIAPHFYKQSSHHWQNVGMSYTCKSA